MSHNDKQSFPDTESWFDIPEKHKHDPDGDARSQVFSYVLSDVLSLNRLIGNEIEHFACVHCFKLVLLHRAYVESEVFSC